MTTGDGVRGNRAVLITGIVLLAVNLRPAITSVPPIFPELRAALGLSAAAVSVLATLPVLCFGLTSGLAAPLARRFGEERVLGAAITLLAAGLLARGLAPGALLFPGTVLAGAAIAMINVLLVSLIKRREPDRAGVLLGLYMLALYLGATLAGATSVPLHQATGGALLPVLGGWALPALIALAAWLPQLSAGTPAGRAPHRVPVHRSPLSWQVAGFFGVQSLVYYATVSWLPTLFRDRGASPSQAGFLGSMLSIGGLLTALLVPVVAHRLRGQRVLVLPAVALCGASILGIWLAPLGTAVVWCGLLGLGQGAALGLALYFTIARAATPAAAASLSALAQSVGYLLATTGPLVVGLLRARTGGWTAPVLLLLALTCAEFLLGGLAARHRVVAADPVAVPA